MSAKGFHDFTSSFDRTSIQPQAAQAEQERQMILEKYPKQHLDSLTMDQYAAGVGVGDTLCDLLTHRTPTLGIIRGVGFKNAGIHKLKGSGIYKSTLENAGDAESDWIRLRAALVRCCELADGGKWEEIDKVSVSNWVPAIRTKLLHIYYPENVLPVYVSGELGHFLEALDVGFSPGSGKWAAAPNRKLLEHLRAMPDLQGWSTFELAALLRSWCPRPQKAVSDVTQPELVIRALQALAKESGDDVVAFTPDQVAERANALFDADIVDCSTVMADMAAGRRKQSDGIAWPVEKTARGLYRLLANDRTNSSPTPSMSTFLNKILYGPPGTGKTHHVIREAAAIIEDRELTSAEAKTAYDKACSEGRVRLVTFHQSFSYEDFIEGIRPVMDESGAARFEVRAGVFKEIATEALFKCLEPVPLADVKNGFESRWRALLMAIADAGELEIPGLKDVIWCLTTTEKGNLRAVNKTTQKELACGHSAMAVVWQKLQPSMSATSMSVSQALGKGAHFGVIAAVYNYMQNISSLTEGETQLSLTLPSHSVVDASQGTITESYLELGPASGWQLRSDKNYPPYVLIIDEINRGNISRIFGELITLIEDDKRHGGTNALRVVLPSSRGPFTVPPNLYILGTMNTADKSLALLDVALRRRFEFEELAPDFSICENLPAPMRAALTQLNERIELRKDRDHRIGHAFFMGVSDEAGFNHAFRRKVVPLLQEYFFNDIDGARFVLGEIDKTASDGFLRPIKTSESLSKHQRNRWRWFTDEQPDMECWERLQNNLG